MRALKINKVSVFGSVIFGLLSLFFSAGTVLADSYPYFYVNRGDIFAGGWFISGGSCDNSLGAVYQTPSSDATRFEGGILTFRNAIFDSSAGSGGASTQFGAFALGIVEKNASSPFYGFASNTANNSNPPNTLTFANNSGGQAGGLFEDSSTANTRIPQKHCVPDYFNKFSPAAQDEGSAASLDPSTLSSDKTHLYSTTDPVHNLVICQRQAASGACVGSGSTITIAASAKITVFVKGSVYIQNDIKYAGGYSEGQIPKFALVVSGSIYIDPAVKRLDGFYIAQPLPKCTGGKNPVANYCANDQVADDTGVIWTCHSNNQTKPDYTFVASCTSGLAFNGAVSAKQVYLLRVGGAPNSPAETFNYWPENVINGPYFSASGGSGFGNIDVLRNLPPVF